MPSFPVVELYRAELRALPFVRLDDAAMVEILIRSANAHQSSAIEGIHPTPEVAALFTMFIEERVPSSVSSPYVTRYVMERIVPADRVLAAKRSA